MGRFSAGLPNFTAIFSPHPWAYQPSPHFFFDQKFFSPFAKPQRFSLHKLPLVSGALFFHPVGKMVIPPSTSFFQSKELPPSFTFVPPPSHALPHPTSQYSLSDPGGILSVVGHRVSFLVLYRNLSQVVLSKQYPSPFCCDQADLRVAFPSFFLSVNGRSPPFYHPHARGGHPCAQVEGLPLRCTHLPVFLGPLAFVDHAVFFSFFGKYGRLFEDPFLLLFYGVRFPC